MVKTFSSPKKLEKRCVSGYSRGVFFATVSDFFLVKHKSFLYKTLGLIILKFNKSIFFINLVLNFSNSTKVLFQKFSFLNFQISQKFYLRNFDLLILKSHKTIFIQKSKTFFIKLKRIKSGNRIALQRLETALLFDIFRETQVFRFFYTTFLFFENDRRINKLLNKSSKKWTMNY